MAILSYFHRQNPGYLKGRLLCNIIWPGKFIFIFFRGRFELLKYVYFCEQKSLIKAGKNKFQDLINGPRMTDKLLTGISIWS